MKRQGITLMRIFSYGLRNFWRNAWLSSAATAVMTVTLLIIITTFTAQLIANDTIAALRQKISVIVYLKDDADLAQVTRFAKELKAVPDVTSVAYTSKEQAQANFSAQNQTQLINLEVLGEIGTNPFPASLSVKTNDPSKINLIEAVIKKANNVALEDKQANDAANSASDVQKTINTVSRVSQFAEQAGLVAGVVFIVISVLIIFNTIRMAIFNRRDEIEIMKLIGASKNFIRGPFIVEASLYGIVAAVISLILLYIALLTRVGYLASYDVSVGDTIKLFQHWAFAIVPAQMVVGILIGVFSALLAMRRYLKL